MNFGFSGEMIFLFFLALILFGPKKLPEIGRQIGRIMNEFRRASNEFRSQIEAEINTLDSQTKPQILPPIKEPLGSLASRILNPPTPEQIKSAENRASEAQAAEARAAGAKAPDAGSAAAAPEPVASPGHAAAEPGLASSSTPAISSQAVPSPAVPSKVAPDA